MPKNATSKYGAALADSVNEMRGKMNTGDMTANTPTPSKPEGGITISRTLLPNVVVDDIVSLKVVSINEEMKEVNLVPKTPTETTLPPPEPVLT
jgi:hypothetical protein